MFSVLCSVVEFLYQKSMVHCVLRCISLLLAFSIVMERLVLAKVKMVRPANQSVLSRLQKWSRDD